jgi:putative flippase GtrA
MKSFYRFLLAGVFNTALGWSIIVLCMSVAGLSPESSNAFGNLVGVLISYHANRRFVFTDAPGGERRFLRFVLVFLIAYTTNLVVLVTLVRGWAFDARLSQMIACVVYTLTAFVLNRYVVFRHRAADRPRAQR